MPESSLPDMSGDLARLARFGANIAEAYSCFIFLPASSPNVTPTSAANLQLVAFHSLSNEVLMNCKIPAESGLIGWVARNARSIHVSPFDRDSRTLGTYRADQMLKSFIGIPILGSLSANKAVSPEACGVLACDSKKSFAFTKTQGKLLEELAVEIARLMELSRASQTQRGGDASWQSFLGRGRDLAEAVGANSVEVLRLKVLNFCQLERTLGTGEAVGLVEQVIRLVQQALPPHFPLYRLPNGDLVLIIDNMMSGFCETKIRAICKHVCLLGQSVEFECRRRTNRERHSKVFELERLIAETDTPNTSQSKEANIETTYEYRRA